MTEPHNQTTIVLSKEEAQKLRWYFDHYDEIEHGVELSRTADSMGRLLRTLTWIGISIFSMVGGIIAILNFRRGSGG